MNPIRFGGPNITRTTDVTHNKEDDNNHDVHAEVAPPAAASRSTAAATWGDIVYLAKVVDDLTNLPRAHIRNHLLARQEDATGQRLEMCQRLKESIQRELKEIKMIQLEKERRLLQIAELEEKGAIYGVGSNHRGQLGLGDLRDRSEFTVIPVTRGASFQQVMTRNDLVFAITEDKKKKDRPRDVYTWGSNGMGPMGISCEKLKESNFKIPQWVESLKEENILGVAVGFHHVCAFNEMSVYSWGYNPNGWQEEQCCHSQHQTPRREEDGCSEHIRVLPDLIPLSSSLKTGEKIIDMSSGGTHFCFLTNNGHVWTWGTRSNTTIPTEINLSGIAIQKISCGSDHTVVSSDFQVFTWGSNDGARLGLGDFEDRATPCEIESLRGMRILDISCGTWHNACIAISPAPAASEESALSSLVPAAQKQDEEKCNNDNHEENNKKTNWNQDAAGQEQGGWLYTWGSGYFGQLGIQATSIAETPTLVPYFRDKKCRLKKIYCGTYHNAALSIDGKLYTWGSNRHNCLGRRTNITSSTTSSSIHSKQDGGEHCYSSSTGSVATDPHPLFTSKPGCCEMFGNVVVGGIGRGYPISVALGHHYTIVCTGPYYKHHHPSESS